MFYPALFTNQFNTAFDELSQIHNALINNHGGVLQLHTNDECGFNLLHDDTEYSPIGSYISLDTNEFTDSYRVGVSPVAPKDDFMIEDSAGRNIPIQWGDIDQMITALQELKERNYDVILKAKECEDEEKQERIKELEEELAKLKNNA